MRQPTRAFAFRLCLAIGCPHPKYLLRHLTSWDIAEWQAYSRMHPFGQDVTDRLLATQLAQFYNANKRAAASDLEADDFLGRREQTPEEMEFVLRSALERSG